MDKLTILMFLFLFKTSTKSQTCVIACIDSNKIIVGTDSKVGNKVIGFGSDNHLNTETATCKIKFTGHVFYIGAGSPMDSLYKIIDVIGIKEASIDKLIFKFRTHVKTWLPTYLRKKVEPNAEYFDRYYKSKNYFSSFFFFNFLNNKPRLIKLAFSIKKHSDNAIIILDTLISIKSADPDAIGTFEALREYYKNPNLYSGSREQIINSIIERQCQLTDTSVGKPISILQVFPNNKYAWYQKGLCIF